MADPRFFTNKGPFTLADIARITGAALREGVDTSRSFNDVAPLDRAGPQEISFIDNSKYLDVFASSQAGACFVREKYADRASPETALLVTDEPYHAYALIAQQFYPKINHAPGISPQAYIDASAILGTDIRIEAGAYIGANVVIGNGCVMRTGCVIDNGVTIGDHCIIGANATISHSLIGNHVILHRGVHIGQDGFGYALSKEGHVKVPQLGRVIIEDHVEIGSGSCIDRGTGPDTIIGSGTKIDNLVQIGHNVHIGRHAIIVAQTGIAGSTKVGDFVVFGGQVGISGHLKIGSGARFAAQSGVITDIPAGASYGGYPAVPVKEWHRQTLAIAKLIKRKGSDHE